LAGREKGRFGLPRGATSQKTAESPTRHTFQRTWQITNGLKFKSLMT